MLALSPPVHSSCATFLPASSADDATDCASQHVPRIGARARRRCRGRRTRSTGRTAAGCRRRCCWCCRARPGTRRSPSCTNPGRCSAGSPASARCAPVAPQSIRSAYVGIRPPARSAASGPGRMPSELYMTTGWSPPPPGWWWWSLVEAASADGAARADAASAVDASRARERRRMATLRESRPRRTHPRPPTRMRQRQGDGISANNAVTLGEGRRPESGRAVRRRGAGIRW